jgi:two-component system, LytTR family, response regulator
MIRTYMIDDELPAIEELRYLLQSYPEVEMLGHFQDPLAALDSLDKPDLVFMDIDMPHINGIELALRLQGKHPGTIVVFVTAYSDYSLDAFRAYPLDYILKPVDGERFRHTMERVTELHRLRALDRNAESTFRIRCFGKFEISRIGAELETMKLSNRKLKELFAYLIYRYGKPVTRGELLDLLFEGVDDKKTVNYLHVTLYNIRNMLESFGISRSLILIKENYTTEIAPGVCDYADFTTFVRSNAVIEAENAAQAEKLVHTYLGAYLDEEDYPWAVETREWLESEYEKLLSRLAEYHAHAGRLERAETFLNELIEYNPISEEGNNGLLDLYMESGRHKDYMKHIRRYAKVLKEELGETPEARYILHYKRLMENLKQQNDI